MHKPFIAWQKSVSAILVLYFHYTQVVTNAKLYIIGFLYESLMCRFYLLVVCSRIFLAKYNIGARKIVVKLSPVNFTNILRAASSPIFVWQKNSKPNWKKDKSWAKHFCTKNVAEIESWAQSYKSFRHLFRRLAQSN